MAEQTMAKSRGNRRGTRTKADGEPRLNREIVGIGLLALTVLLFLSFVTYRVGTGIDPEATNWIGPVGAFLAENFYFTFGLGAYAFVFLAAIGSTSLLFGHRIVQSAGHALGSVLLLLTASGLFPTLWTEAQAYGVPIGGQLGEFISTSVSGLFGRAGAIVILSTLLVIALMLVTRTSVVHLMQAISERSGMSGTNPIRAAVSGFLGGIASLFRRAGAWLSGAREKSRERSQLRRERRAARKEERAERKRLEEAAAAEELEEIENGDEELVTTDEDGSWEGERASSTRARRDEAADAAAAAAVEQAEVLEEEEPAIPIQEAVPSPLDRALDEAERHLFDADDDFQFPDNSIENPMRTPTRRVGGDEASPTSRHSARSVEAAAIDEGQAPRRSVADILGSANRNRSDATPTAASAVAPEPSNDAPTAQHANVSPTPAAPAAPNHEVTGEPALDGPKIVESDAQKNRKSASDLEREALELMKSEERDLHWKFPPLNFLNYEEPDGAGFDSDELREIASRLEQVLEDFKVKGNVSNICPGPVVTRFEFEPEPGTKLRKISNLSDDIAMALRAEKVRIIAPIPGKGCVGFEIPNDNRETVYLKEVLGSQEFNKAKSKVTLALGKDIEGYPVVANLAKMPHLLVAGTTGSGKSVAVNSMIVSMLYNASPDDVRMILIDPKQLEFAIYEDIPHLLLPVVTDPSKAATALQWAVTEMERRYKLMKELRVRNVEGYNAKLEKMHQEYEDALAKGQSPKQKLTDLLTEVDDNDRPRHRHMPYLVVVVDEFADLMMVAGKDVEQAVARLAQKARAAGIHCILATQRPSVDVLTGLIKANFPTRISFRLMSGTDSRTVLDTMGAENLLGMGDMLFRPPGSSDLVRVHGAFVDEEEIDDIVGYLKEQGEAEYDESILNPPEEEHDEDEEVDEKYDEAVQCVVEAGYASISMVQRKLRVGYNRAARMVDHMEREGIIGPATGGSSRRDVLVNSY